jgi:VanZ family protein
VTRLIIWLPPFVWMAVIIGFSGGTFRDEATGSVVRPLLHALFPWATAMTIDALHYLIRKSAHLFEYAILATLWFTALQRGADASKRAATWQALIISIGWGIVDELYQASGTTRAGSARDVAIDASGALVASFFSGYGWRYAVTRLTAALLWIAAAGGAAVIVLNLSTGVASGVLWLTVPAAAALLVWRWRRNVVRPVDPGV